MLVVPPVAYRPRRGRVKVKVAPPTTALTLVAATYDDGAQTLRLRFDRAINSAGIDGAAITVRDGSFDDNLYNGVSAVNVIDPATIEVTLVNVGSYDVDEVTLSVTAGSGIVAVNNGGTWAGVVNLVLPWP